MIGPFIRRLLRIKAAGAAQLADGTWHRGELAVCISDGWLPRCRHSPAKGDVLRVAQVETVGGIVFLTFFGIPQHGFAAGGFRKAVHDDRAADAAWAAALKRARPTSAPQRQPETVS